jgi:hypothetical protein
MVLAIADVCHRKQYYEQVVEGSERSKCFPPYSYRNLPFRPSFPLVPHLATKITCLYSVVVYSGIVVHTEFDENRSQSVPWLERREERDRNVSLSSRMSSDWIPEPTVRLFVVLFLIHSIWKVSRMVCLCLPFMIAFGPFGLSLTRYQYELVCRANSWDGR